MISNCKCNMNDYKKYFILFLIYLDFATITTFKEWQSYCFSL